MFRTKQRRTHPPRTTRSTRCSLTLSVLAAESSDKVSIPSSPTPSGRSSGGRSSSSCCWILMRDVCLPPLCGPAQRESRSRPTTRPQPRPRRRPSRSVATTTPRWPRPGPRPDRIVEEARAAADRASGERSAVVEAERRGRSDRPRWPSSRRPAPQRSASSRATSPTSPRRPHPGRAGSARPGDAPSHRRRVREPAPAEPAERWNRTRDEHRTHAHRRRSTSQRHVAAPRLQRGHLGHARVLIVAFLLVEVREQARHRGRWPSASQRIAAELGEAATAREAAEAERDRIKAALADSRHRGRAHHRGRPPDRGPARRRHRGPRPGRDRRSLRERAAADLAATRARPSPTSPARSPAGARRGRARSSRRNLDDDDAAAPDRAATSARSAPATERTDTGHHMTEHQIHRLRRSRLRHRRAEGTITEVEDELFRFARALEGNDELRSTLDRSPRPRGASPADRRGPARRQGHRRPRSPSSR